MYARAAVMPHYCLNDAFARRDRQQVIICRCRRGVFGPGSRGVWRRGGSSVSAEDPERNDTSQSNPVWGFSTGERDSGAGRERHHA